MVDIIPAILPKTREELEEDDLLLPPNVFVHIDVLEEDVWTPIHRPFEAHIMVSKPEEKMEKWINRGAKRIIVHKASDTVLGYRKEIELGLGVELNIAFEDFVELVKHFDFVHLMSIAEIGEQDHPLEPEIFDRIKKLKGLHPDAVISVDGGIKLDNAEELVAAGADRLIIGSAIIGELEPEEAYEQFLEIAK